MHTPLHSCISSLPSARHGRERAEDPLSTPGSSTHKYSGHIRYCACQHPLQSRLILLVLNVVDEDGIMGIVRAPVLVLRHRGMHLLEPVELFVIRLHVVI